MARPSKFSRDEILDAALLVVGRRGSHATIAEVSETIGAPSGSIYHRFASREELFVSLWLRAVERFQAGLLVAAELPDPHVALARCAVHITSYCRAHPDEAVALTLYRQHRLLTDGPPVLADRVRTLNDGVEASSARLTTRRYGRATARRRALVATACRQLPYGLVRPYVGGPVPLWLDGVTEAAATAVLALGDS